MTTNSYKSRTTLWDDDVSAQSSAPASGTRGAWRAPSVPAGRRATSGNSSASRGALDRTAEDTRTHARLEDEVPRSRRPKSYGSLRPWWRPRTTFGRVLLGTGAVLIIAALVSAGVIVHNFLRHDPHFRIPGASSIQSVGLGEVTRAEILPIFGEDIGRNTFFVPLRERRKQLEQIPWVKQATVMRLLPDRLSVSIVERTPVAFVNVGQEVQLVDADGVILAMPPAMMAQHHYSFPVLSGINAQDALSARKARMAVYQRFIAELDQSQQHQSDVISEIDLSDPEDLRATISEQGTDILAHFGEDQFLNRLQIYKAHIAEWRQRYPKLIGVDLRYSGEVPLEMASDKSVDSTTDAKTEESVKPAAASTAKPVTSLAAKAVKAAPGMDKKAADKKKLIAEHQVVERRAAEARKKAARLKAEKAHAAAAKAAHPGQAHTLSTVRGPQG